MASNNFNLNKSSGTSYIIGRIVWSSQAYNSENYSLVNADLYVKKGNDSIVLTDETTGKWGYSLSIGNNTISGSIQKSVLTSWVKVASLAGVKVTHNPDGSQSIAISGSVTAPSGTSYAGKETSGSKTVSLDNIPRASAITSASAVTIGNKCGIKWTPNASSFRYKIKFSLGNWSYTTGVIYPNKTSAYTYNGYSIPLSCVDQYDSGNSWTMKATLYTYSDSACTKQIGSASSKEFTVTLPGASTITSASNTILGEKLKVKFTPKHSSYRYKVAIAVKGKDYSYESGVIAPAKVTEHTYEVALSLVSIAPYITTKTGTMSVTLTTYRDSDCKKKVGSSNNKEFTATVPNTSATQPSLTMSLDAVDSISSSQFDGLYIQGKSRVKASFTATGKYGADIVSSVMNVDNKNYSSSPWQSALFSTSGKKTVKGTVTDSRGHNTTVTKEIDVIPYSVPQIKPISGKIVCERCDENGNLAENGTSLRIELKRVYSRVVVGGSQKNFCEVQYRHRVAGSSTFSSWITLLSKKDISDSVARKVSGVELNVKKSYDIQIRAVDDVGSSSVVVSFVIPTDEITFHLGAGGKRVSVGKWSERKYDENGNEIPHFEVPEEWSSYFKGPVYGNVYGLEKAETTVADGTDLNSLIDFGVYAIPRTAGTSTMKNIPVKKAGRLIVSSANGMGIRIGTYSYILQEYISIDGSDHCYRMGESTDGSQWVFDNWTIRNSPTWVDLGLHTNVKQPVSTIGRSSHNCAYRVENGNHVYIAFQCGVDYAGTALRVNTSEIPEGLRPAKYVYGFCANSSKSIVRVSVSPAGIININWVQHLTTSSETTSASLSWIDGYIDYWI